MVSSVRGRSVGKPGWPCVSCHANSCDANFLCGCFCSHFNKVMTVLLTDSLGEGEHSCNPSENPAHLRYAFCWGRFPQCRYLPRSHASVGPLHPPCIEARPLNQSKLVGMSTRGIYFLPCKHILRVSDPRSCSPSKSKSIFAVGPLRMRMCLFRKIS